MIETAEGLSSSLTLPSTIRGRIVPRSWEAWKRALDICISATVLLLSSPIILLSMLAICVTSPGSPIFVHERIGRHGRPFMMYKLRTMVTDAHRLHQTRLVKQKHDPRVLPVGRILRKVSIDELMNLVNVLRGDMSIVGPRPMLDNEIRACIERHGEAATLQRLAVKPGITGLWQVSGRANLHFDDRVKLDITYATSWTPWGDLQILWRTIPIVFFARGAY